MVVHRTLGAMSIGKVTEIDPDNKYMITVSTGDPIPWGSIIYRVRKPNSSGDLVVISSKKKWQACETYQCEAAHNDNALSDAICAKSARVSGVFNVIANSLVEKGAPSDIFCRLSGPVPTNMLVESPDNVGLAENSWNGLFSSLKFDY
jgi:hypothetical protein